MRRSHASPLFPYTTLFRSEGPPTERFRACLTALSGGVSLNHPGGTSRVVERYAPGKGCQAGPKSLRWRAFRSEERRVGKQRRGVRSTHDSKQKKQELIDETVQRIYSHNTTI